MTADAAGGEVPPAWWDDALVARMEAGAQRIADQLGQMKSDVRRAGAEAMVVRIIRTAAARPVRRD